MSEAVHVGVYVHIPFCASKCLYCDFNSYAGMTSLQDSYVGAAGAEAAAICNAAQDTGSSLVAKTLYLGGGTPSLLTASQTAAILGKCTEHFAWEPSMETTIEANPGTLDLGHLVALRELGINRISLGIQSLDNAELRRLGRVHTAEDGLLAYQLCRKATFSNVSVDLMFGLPGQTLGSWARSLRSVVELAPEHLSLYCLSLEAGTPFHRMFQEGRLSLPGDAAEAAMYEIAEDILGTSGYVHYEISNWARAVLSGRIGADQALSTADTKAPLTPRCEHNMIYWRNEPYVGLGAGAHSRIGDERYWNEASPLAYIKLAQIGRSTVAGREKLSDHTQMAETAFLALRTSDGIRRDVFEKRFGVALGDVFKAAIADCLDTGLLVDTEQAIMLSPRGRLLGNEVFVRFVTEAMHQGDHCTTFP
ncbi:MAG: radical SAM family heme chaperone HemW [Chloroflexi bacterium]|nr:radical SAM family heme chaperone HemW [Chloroflexota bacterium]